MNDEIFDLVTVFHNARNQQQAHDLELALQNYADLPYAFWQVDNRTKNRGFAPGCNMGARAGTAPIIGFLNPDVVIAGQFMRTVAHTLMDTDVVITGERFGKSEQETQGWGCRDWVCGAAFFVKRPWFESVGGFDEHYLFGWEETDLCRLAQTQKKFVRSIDLPIVHASPTDDSWNDVQYKQREFKAGAKYFFGKWKGR